MVLRARGGCEMSGILYTLAAAAVGLICCVMLIQASRAGLVPADDSSAPFNRNPVSYFLMIVLSSAGLGFCIAYILFGFGLGDDPVRIFWQAVGLTG